MSQKVYQKQIPFDKSFQRHTTSRKIKSLKWCFETWEGRVCKELRTGNISRLEERVLGVGMWYEEKIKSSNSKTCVDWIGFNVMK